MKKFWSILLPFLALSVNAWALQIGEHAPEFTGMDSNGKSVALSKFKGQFVVLEWHNQDCPFVKKHYNSGNIPSLQSEWTKKGVAWLTIISSAPGKQGYVDGKGANADMSKHKASPTAVLLDPKGEIAHLYGAKTTPHMYVISPAGNLIYAGAIDDHPTTDASDIPNSKNYVSMALTEAMGGNAVSHPATTAYGCGVKYAD